MRRALARTLAARMLAIGLAQLTVLALLAVLIALVTMPAPPREPLDRPLAPPRGEPFDRPPAPPPRASETWLGTTPPPFGVGPLLTLVAGVIVIGAGSYLTARWIVAPLGVLAGAAKRVADGDLSARAGLERGDELGDVARAFDEMSERVQGLLVAERQLLADVSHELRTPLARIHVAVDLAAEGDHDAARAALADIAIDLAELEKIVDDILTAHRLGHVEHGALRPGALAVVEAAELARWCAERFRHRHPERPLELALPERSTPVRADGALLRRAIDNLLDNAHKYTDRPELPVRLSFEVQAERVIFEVSDRGRGIPAADLEHVWKPFFRVDPARSRAPGGVGLGLTIARRIVEAHGGSVGLDSALGAGTKVRISLPLARA